MNLKPHSDGSKYDLTDVSDTERRILVDALTNLSLDAAKGAADSHDHDGRGSPSAEAAGGYLEAANAASDMAKKLKDGH